MSESAARPRISAGIRPLLMKAAGAFSRPERKTAKERSRAAKEARRIRIKMEERKARAETGIRSAREANIFKAPFRVEHDGQGKAHERGPLHSPGNCYICKKEFVKLHHFYDAMCMECGGRI